MYKIYKNIHYPASYYFASGYVPEFEEQLLNIINNYEKNSIFINYISMNNNTYNWMFRVFNTPINKKACPLKVDIEDIYLYDYPIKIVSNSSMNDGEIFIVENEDNGMA